MHPVKALRTALVASAIAILPLAADPWSKRTLVTIGEPVQLPTTTLQPGTYTFKLLDSPSNRHIVGVWDKDGMRHVTTVLAIPNYRLQPTGDTQFAFWETPADQPRALRAWFYPGDNFGQEFTYPKDRIALFARNREPVPVQTKSDASAIAAAPVTESVAQQAEVQQPVAPKPAEPEPQPDPEPVIIAQATPPPAQPEPAREPTPPPAEPLAAMPQTASNWAEVTGAGLLAGLAGLLTYRKTRTA